MIHIVADTKFRFHWTGFPTVLLKRHFLRNIKGSVHSEFLIFVMIKCIFLTDLRSKTMTCYTFSVRPTIPEYRNVKVAMKKIDEEENEDFCEEEYFT